MRKGSVIILVVGGLISMIPVTIFYILPSAIPTLIIQGSMLTRILVTLTPFVLTLIAYLIEHAIHTQKTPSLKPNNAFSSRPYHITPEEREEVDRFLDAVNHGDNIFNETPQQLHIRSNGYCFFSAILLSCYLSAPQALKKAFEEMIETNHFKEKTAEDLLQEIHASPSFAPNATFLLIKTYLEQFIRANATSQHTKTHVQEAKRWITQYEKNSCPETLPVRLWGDANQTPIYMSQILGVKIMIWGQGGRNRAPTRTLFDQDNRRDLAFFDPEKYESLNANIPTLYLLHAGAHFSALAPQKQAQNLLKKPYHAAKDLAQKSNHPIPTIPYHQSPESSHPSPSSPQITPSTP